MESDIHFISSLIILAILLYHKKDDIARSMQQPLPVFTLLQKLLILSAIICFVTLFILTDFEIISDSQMLITMLVGLSWFAALWSYYKPER